MVCQVNQSFKLHMGARLTISRGPVEAMRSIDVYVNDHYKADNAPEEGYDDKTAAEALLACFSSS
jgi:hypothetical protein